MATCRLCSRGAGVAGAEVLLGRQHEGERGAGLASSAVCMGCLEVVDRAPGLGASGQVCDGTVLRQVGEVPQGAADSQNPEDGKQFATARLAERRSCCTENLLAGWKFAYAHSSRSGRPARQ